MREWLKPGSFSSSASSGLETRLCTTILIYEFAAKHQKKEHKLGGKKFLLKSTTSRGGAVNSTETRKG